SSKAKRSYWGIELRNSALLPALKFSSSGTMPMPSGRIRISSSSVPGRRVGLTIPTTPRHNVKLMVDPPAPHTIGSAAPAAHRGGPRGRNATIERPPPGGINVAVKGFAMFAWRARIGLVKPTHRGKSFHFWYKRAPDGVEIVPTFVGFRRSDRQTFENAFERIEQIAEDLKAAGCDIIALSGTPPVLLKGLDFEREW